MSKVSRFEGERRPNARGYLHRSGHATEQGECVLDFGAGTGILLPTHHAVASRVVCTDLRLGPCRELARLLGLPTELVALEDFSTWAERNAGRVNCIYALDFLEHLGDDELAELLPRFRALLGERDRLIVSGPTESAAYRLGRWLAGFTGEYHQRNVFDVDRAVHKHLRREAWVGLPARPLPRAFWLGRYVS